MTYPPPPSNPGAQQPGPSGPHADPFAVYASMPTPPSGFRQPMPAVPRRRKNAGTAVTAGILGLLTALIYGGYGLLAWIVSAFGEGGAAGWLFAILLVAGIAMLAGAILVFVEKFAGGVLLLVACGLFTLGSVLLAVVPVPGFLSGQGEVDDPNDPRMLFHLVGILPVAVIALLVLLPSTRRYLAAEASQPPGGPMPGQPMPVAAPNPAGQAMTIGAAVCGFVLGLILLSIWIDVGVAPTLGLDVLPQVLGVLLAVVGGAVALGRKWSGGLLLAIGGGICLAYILVALFRSDGESDFRGVVFLLASIGALVLSLLPPARAYLRRE